MLALMRESDWFVGVVERDWGPGRAAGCRTRVWQVVPVECGHKRESKQSGQQDCCCRLRPLTHLALTIIVFSRLDAQQSLGTPTLSMNLHHR
ncbi:hypothetical protein U9M48_036953 [Paspalum notatum var. saurae]|uniref:Uncharacterized protein n=1 Tax=Paspalum notatum var. saurae TaxID=547442 RepID=A0AAQ3XAK5_PASNO